MATSLLPLSFLPLQGLVRHILGSREFSQGETQQNETPQGEVPLQEEEPLQETTSTYRGQPLSGPKSRLEPDDLQPGEGLYDAKTPQDLKNPPHIEQPHAKGATDDPRFTYVDGFLYYPRLPVLLESLIRARLRIPENEFGMWVSMLEVWAIPYLWGQTMAPEDILDGIKDDKIKAWFNKATKRFEGGIDRVTITKRQGRLRSTRPLEDIDL